MTFGLRSYNLNIGLKWHLGCKKFSGKTAHALRATKTTQHSSGYILLSFWGALSSTHCTVIVTETIECVPQHLCNTCRKKDTQTWLLNKYIWESFSSPKRISPNYLLWLLYCSSEDSSSGSFLSLFQVLCCHLVGLDFLRHAWPSLCLWYTWQTEELVETYT